MRRFIIAFAAAAAIIAAYTYFIKPLPEKRDAARESLEVKYTALNKYREFIKSGGAAGAELDAAGKDVEELEAGILQDKTESLAFAKLEEYINDFTEKSGLKIISIKPLSVVKYTHYASMPIQLEASGGITQLGEFLRQLDSTKQLIKIDRLNINVVNTQMPGDLRIRIQISGLMKVAGS